MDPSRLPRLTPTELSVDQSALYEQIAGGERARGPQAFALVGEDGSLEGPFNAFLYQTALGTSLESLGAAIRYRTSLTDREREIAILLTANHRDSEFERYAHEAIARNLGMTQDELAALRELSTQHLHDEREVQVATTVLALLHNADLTDDEYQSAVAVLGEVQLVEITTLVGHYSTLAMQMNVFGVRPPEQVEHIE